MARTVKVPDEFKQRIEELADENGLTQQEIAEQLMDAGFQEADVGQNEAEAEQREAVVGWCPHCHEPVEQDEMGSNFIGQVTCSHDCEDNSFPFGQTHIADELLEEPPEQ